uniref:Putative Kunitz-type serine protease inhibitor n=1 Tax=Lycosa tarantula TaxID=332795 RepID=A0A7G7FEX5_LYCTA|nr:putative Kunitz-type serine protease inhibitor [Lycosa tarantula]
MVSSRVTLVVAIITLSLLILAIHSRPADYNTEPVCSLPADPGHCYAFFEKFFFNGTSCEIFIYGGCLGNGNKFDEKEECEQTCLS